MKTVFESRDYKSYLRGVLDAGRVRSGQRAKLAEHLECQTAHISQVLNGHANFSNEHAFRINSFLGHDREESHFFILLFNKDRAGTKDLREYYQSQMEEILDRRQLIKNRVDAKLEISAEQQARYYSSWHYLALHMALTVPELQSKEKLAEYFHLPLNVVADTLEFLIDTGLAIRDGGTYRFGTRHMHLGGDADNVNKHHLNWRVQAMDSLTRAKTDDLHYSVVYSLSAEDARKIRERTIEMIKANLKDVGPSKEEVLFCSCIDFFEVRK